MRTKFLPIIALAVTSLISACGPIYNTNFLYSPPRSPEGRACIFQCNQVQLQCEQIEDLQKQNCENGAENKKRECEWQTRRREGRDPKWYECSSESCSANYERCAKTYRSCYQSCGGSIKTETVCVSNCEQVKK